METAAVLKLTLGEAQDSRSLQEATDTYSRTDSSLQSALGTETYLLFVPELIQLEVLLGVVVHRHYHSSGTKMTQLYHVNVVCLRFSIRLLHHILAGRKAIIGQKEMS